MPSILIVQEHMPSFRKLFYEQLRARLSVVGIHLDLVYAPNQRNTFVKADLDWAIPIPVRRFGSLVWHPVVGLARKYDLVIVQQEVKYAVNPVLQALAALGGPPVAYWGHGRNFQKQHEGGVSGVLKRWLSRQVHWWFAYNDLSARVVAELGYPRERITSVGNAVDTTGLARRLRETTPQELAALREKLGLGDSQNVAVYTGGLYVNKCLPFLIEAAQRIRAAVPDFHLLVIGSGPDRGLITEAAAAHPWIHDIGPLGEQDKVPYWALSKLLLMPGLVGLVVVDSFALGTPLVTTDYPFHSPEIDYLESGRNGLIVPCGESVEMYADAVIDLLRDPARLAAMREQAFASAGRHTIENMAANFAAGVQAALAARR